MPPSASKKPIPSPSSQRAWIEIWRPRVYFQPQGVALLAEGVDRNLNMASDAALQLSSPSSQRAWIEIAAT